MTKNEILEGVRACAKKLRRVPTVAEVERMLKINRRVIKRHFPKLDKFLRDEARARAARSARQKPQGRPRKARMKIRKDRPVYGPPSNMRGLRYEPTSEGGVMFAFGQMAERLGFEVERIQVGYPDCEAMREVAPGKWQRLKIEFEYASRNFVDHGHALGGCDMIVCWVHNWVGCPAEIEVIELREVARGIGGSEKQKLTTDERG